MNIIEPSRYKPKTQVKKPRVWPWIVLIILVSGLTYNYLRPLPAPVVSMELPPLRVSSGTQLSWPHNMQASFGAMGYGVLAKNGDSTPLATASIAKVITALCVLQKLPLSPSQSGPVFTVNMNDVALYEDNIVKNGSLIPVVEGEQLTEYQALEALMLPSANNIADSLVQWVFGSQAEYNRFATNFVKSHGMLQTTIGNDASGFSDSTVSTAADLTVLGNLAQKDPVLMEVAGKQSAELPVVGTVTNYNTVLGQVGITGLKTGNNESNPGAFLFTAIASIDNKNILLSGAVMGAPDLISALNASVKLVASVPSGFEAATITTAGEKVGRVSTAWGTQSAIICRSTSRLFRWKDYPVHQTKQVAVHLNSKDAGILWARSGPNQTHTQLVLANNLTGPSIWWRLVRH